jgi:hypothetical protein
MMQIEPITRVGCLNLSLDDRKRGLKILEAELANVSGKENLLLVLPEAFNIPGDYNPVRGHFDSVPDPNVVRALEKIALESGVAFVAGLIEGSCNVSRLIDPKNGLISHDLVHKRSNDKSGRYQPCFVHRGCSLEHRGIAIASHICDDATNFSADSVSLDFCWSVDFLKRTHLPRVVCIPSHFTVGQERGVAVAWATVAEFAIVANSSLSPSVIATHEDAELIERTTIDYRPIKRECVAS